MCSSSSTSPTRPPTSSSPAPRPTSASWAAANPFFHTGNPVQLAAGPYQSYQPWLWPDRVARATAFGKDRATLETIGEWAARMASEAF